MSGICDTCKRSNVCRKPIGGVDSCRRYVRAKESNYQRLFGTPERAALTVLSLDYCCENCDECPAFEICGLHSKFGRTIYEMTEWLRGDAE